MNTIFKSCSLICLFMNPGADEIQEMIDRADPSGNMAVSLDDFCHVMTKKTFPQPN